MFIRGDHEVDPIIGEAPSRLWARNGHLYGNNITMIAGDMNGDGDLDDAMDFVYSHVAPTLTAGVASLIASKLDSVSFGLGSTFGSKRGSEDEPGEGDDFKLTVH